MDKPLQLGLASGRKTGRQGLNSESLEDRPMSIRKSGQVMLINLLQLLRVGFCLGGHLGQTGVGLILSLTGPKGVSMIKEWFRMGPVKFTDEQMAEVTLSVKGLQISGVPLFTSIQAGTLHQSYPPKHRTAVPIQARHSL